mmetsp:Transcript_19731/g.55766  ORF Transcript_19731/g.55766 Transcript_19731/m.55766 type:complete len:214 (-) Transcript_19731:440-1081(-)
MECGLLLMTECMFCVSFDVLVSVLFLFLFLFLVVEKRDLNMLATEKVEDLGDLSAALAVAVAALSKGALLGEECSGGGAKLSPGLNERDAVWLEEAPDMTESVDGVRWKSGSGVAASTSAVTMRTRVSFASLLSVLVLVLPLGLLMLVLLLLPPVSLEWACVSIAAGGGIWQCWWLFVRRWTDERASEEAARAVLFALVSALLGMRMRMRKMR